MRIGIDIDDTLTNFQNIVVPYAQKYNIEELGNRKLLNIYSKHTIEMFDWTEKESDEFWFKYAKNLMTEVLPLPFAVKTVTELYDKGNEIYIITARSNYYFKEAYEHSKKWLEKHGIKYHDLIVGAENKGDVCLNNEIDILIDDGIENCKSLVDVNIPVLMFDASSNRGFNIEGVKRVHSWTEVSHVINSMRN